MLRKMITAILISYAIFLVIALTLIISQPPAQPKPSQQAGLDFNGVMSQGQFVAPAAGFTRTALSTSDGATLVVTHVVDATAKPDLPLIVMLHGSGWHNAQFDRLAWALRDVAEVKALTLRGHGEQPIRRGDVDYIGQMEDDIAQLIQQTPNRKVVLLGHSSGGGLAIRFAGGKHKQLISAAVLLAPYLKYNAPTIRENAGGWTHPLTRRLIGLSMLNLSGIRWLNHLIAVQFSIPDEVLQGPQGHFATQHYSYRLNTGYAPRNKYLDDIAALPRFVLVAGLEDEAFYANKYQQLMSAVTDNGDYILVPGIGHLDIVDAPQTQAAIRKLLQTL